MFNDTIRKKILYGRQNATQEELVQSAQDAQLLDFIVSLDGDGWESMVGDRGLKLSGKSHDIWNIYMYIFVGLVSRACATLEKIGISDNLVFLFGAYNRWREAKSRHCPLSVERSSIQAPR